MAQLFNPQKGTWVLLSFAAFFGVIVAVNAVFITLALETHSGVVVERPYERGLAFNEILEKARAQADIEYDVSYEGGVLRLSLPVTTAEVAALFMRQVKGGDDFEMVLAHRGGGVYEAVPEMPLPGAWRVRLKARWEKQTFQTVYELIAQ